MPTKAERLRKGRLIIQSWKAMAESLLASPSPEANALGYRMMQNANAAQETFFDKHHWLFHSELRKQR